MERLGLPPHPRFRILRIDRRGKRASASDDTGWVFAATILILFSIASSIRNATFEMLVWCLDCVLPGTRSDPSWFTCLFPCMFFVFVGLGWVGFPILFLWGVNYVLLTSIWCFSCFRFLGESEKKRNEFDDWDSDFCDFNRIGCSYDRWIPVLTMILLKVRFFPCTKMTNLLCPSRRNIRILRNSELEFVTPLYCSLYWSYHVMCMMMSEWATDKRTLSLL